MRTLVPGDSLVYLETNDLAAAIQPIVDSKPFGDVAKSKPDLSALKGVQIAVAVTGFETSEERLTDEHSVGRVQPHFVAVAETHAWNYQAVGFAEKKLGSFVENIYNSQPTLEKTEKSGGKYFTWTAKDGRKAYALVIDSLIYFGNDETSIEKCLAVKRGEADSISKSGKVPQAAPGTLASGYVGSDGIAQIANIVGLKFASEAGEDGEVQSAIAGILPNLIRSSITDVSWTMTKTEQGIEDKYAIGMPAEIANVFSETFTPGGLPGPAIFANLSDVSSVTRYNLKDPQIAWRSVVLTLQKQIDPLGGKIINAISGSLFEPYGIRDPEMFLSAVDSNILTAKIDAEGEKPFVIATIRDSQKVSKSIVAVKSNPPTEEGVSFWRTEDNEIEAVFDGNLIMIGSVEGVGSGFSGGAFPTTTPKKETLDLLIESRAPIATLGRDDESAGVLADIISEKKYEGAGKTSFLTETRFTKTGMERKTTSDFGLIGSIIAQLGED